MIVGARPVGAPMSHVVCNTAAMPRRFVLANLRSGPRNEDTSSGFKLTHRRSNPQHDKLYN